MHALFAPRVQSEAVLAALAYRRACPALLTVRNRAGSDTRPRRSAIDCVRVGALNAAANSRVAESAARNSAGGFVAGPSEERVAELTLRAFGEADADSAVGGTLSDAGDFVLVCEGEALETFDAEEETVSPRVGLAVERLRGRGDLFALFVPHVVDEAVGAGIAECRAWLAAVAVE